jgi:putative oxidoreductase
MTSANMTAPRVRWSKAGLWIAKGLVALIFAVTGSAKLAGVAMVVAMFEQIGLGQGFRYFTGFVELAGAVAVLVPGTSFYGALMLGAVCIGAFIAQLGPLHGDVIHPIVFAALVGIVGWFSRPR